MIVSDVVFMMYFGYESYKGVCFQHQKLDNGQAVGISTRFSWAG